jgi:hypothetical protein
MPPAKRSTSTTARRVTNFKPPAALNRLNQSIDAAEKALVQLSKHGGRDVSQGSRDLYKNLKTFVTSARRDSGKFAKSIQKDLEQAQKTLTTKRPARSSTTRSRSTAAKSTRSTTAKRSPAKRTTKRSS